MTLYEYYTCRADDEDYSSEWAVSAPNAAEAAALFAEEFYRIENDFDVLRVVVENEGGKRCTFTVESRVEPRFVVVNAEGDDDV